ncbi:MAG: hypothetical protein HOB18_05185 [Nitrospina sp.]|nr:hypothetical protein [Nitrospina sp.]
MKKNAIRVTTLENKLVGNKSDFFRLSDFELLERIEECEFKSGKRPTQLFVDMKKEADKTKPIFSPKGFQRLRYEQDERNAEMASMNELEFQDHLDKLIIENDMAETFEDMSEQNIKDNNKPKKEQKK